MQEHPFHRAMPGIVSYVDLGPCRWIWADECQKGKRVSLFRERAKSSVARYTCPDAALVQGSTVHLILEIEEQANGGFGPQRVMGKFYSAAHWHYLVGRERDAVPIRFAPAATFIQVLSNARLRAGSRKVEQYRNIERDIQGKLPFRDVAHYFLIAAHPDDFSAGEAGLELQRRVAEVVARCSAAAAIYVGP